MVRLLLRLLQEPRQCLARTFVRCERTIGYCPMRRCKETITSRRGISDATRASGTLMECIGCSAFTSWRARKRDPKTLALPAHNQKLVLRHVTFVLQQLFQISLERGLCFNHRVEGFLHLGRQIICIDILPLQFFPCHALLQLGRRKRRTLIRDQTMVCTGLAFGSTAPKKNEASHRRTSRPTRRKFKPTVPVATCEEPTFRRTVRFLRRHEHGRGQAPSFGGVAETFDARNRGVLVAARLRGSKKRTHRAALGTTANWAFCKLRGLLIGDFVGSKPQQGTAWAEHGRRYGGGLGGCLWVEGGSTRLSWL